MFTFIFITIFMCSVISTERNTDKNHTPIHIELQDKEPSSVLCSLLEKKGIGSINNEYTFTEPPLPDMPQIL